MLSSHPLEMIHDINTLKFQELMGILKNVDIKLQAQRQSEEVKPQMQGKG